MSETSPLKIENFLYMHIYSEILTSLTPVRQRFNACNFFQHAPKRDSCATLMPSPPQKYTTVLTQIQLPQRYIIYLHLLSLVTKFFKNKKLKIPNFLTLFLRGRKKIGQSLCPTVQKSVAALRVFYPLV